MDFNAINTKADEERGAPLHLKHPQLKHPLYTGPGADSVGRWVHRDKPAEAVVLRVRGAESPTVRAALERQQKRAMKGAASDEADEERAIKGAISFVTEVSGVYDGKRKITASEEDLRWLFARSDDFILQVVNFATDKSNFFGEPADVS